MTLYHKSIVKTHYIPVISANRIAPKTSIIAFFSWYQFPRYLFFKRLEVLAASVSQRVHNHGLLLLSHNQCQLIMRIWGCAIHLILLLISHGSISHSFGIIRILDSCYFYNGYQRGVVGAKNTYPSLETYSTISAITTSASAENINQERYCKTYSDMHVLRMSLSDSCTLPSSVYDQPPPVLNLRRMSQKQPILYPLHKRPTQPLAYQL